MIHTREIQCPHCHSNGLVRQGKTGNGTQKWQCNSCKKHFRLEYRYNAWKAGTGEKIAEMTLNSSGVRDTGRVLQINRNTVCAVLKKNAKKEPVLSDSRRVQRPFKVGSRNTFFSRDGRILEFCWQEKQSAADVVCYGTPFGNHIGVARETARQGFFSALGTVKTLSDTKVSHRYMGSVFKIW